MRRPSSQFRSDFTAFLSVLPLFVHIKTARAALSAERVYDIHCVTFGSRPSALVSWWLGSTQLLDHSTSVSERCKSALSCGRRTRAAVQLLTCTLYGLCANQQSQLSRLVYRLRGRSCDALFLARCS